MTRRTRRLAMIGSALAVLAVALGLVLVALRDRVVFFYSPSELAEKPMPPGQRFRVGGLVKDGSIEKAGRVVRFVVTDTAKDVPVSYEGDLPDLFREGQGVVAEGALEPSGLFRAGAVLAKHDERYMPREVADALKKQGVWQGTEKK